MNAEQLLERYERVADAPDAVARLRRLVLDLAICGKLIEADRKRWADRPIESCLAALPDGKRIHQGWSPQCEQHPSPSDEEWGVLRTTAIQDGYFVEAENKKLPDALTPKPRLEVQSDDILITCAGPRARCGISCRVLNVRRRLLISGKMYRFRANTDLVAPGYLSLFLRADETKARIDAMKTGSSESGLNLTQDRFRLLTVRFGPIQEQHRIVAKVDELMALCDRLEAARSQREATRNRLTAATLARLNTPEPQASPDGDASEESRFQSDARFALKVLPALTNRPDQIKQLRQTILNFAVRGLLTQAASTDIPAQTLLRKLADEAPLKRTSSSKLSDSRPFQIPGNWEWAALGDLIVDGPQNGLSPKPTTRHDAPKAITLTATTSGVFDPAHFKHVEATLPDDSDFWLRDGDLLFQRGNTREYVGIAAVYTGPPRAFLFPDLMIRVRVSACLNLRYIHLAAIAPPARKYFSESASGAQLTMPKINQAVLLALPVPLPPLAEQHRIVAKVDGLMDLCDQLEASLTHGENTRSRLLNALLHEALHPRHDHVIDMDTARQRLREKREAVACRGVERMSRSKGVGRVRVVKALYFAEAHCRTALGGHWGRGDFGPYDHWILSFESSAGSAGWLTRTEHPAKDGGTRIEYKPGPKLSARAQAAAQALGDQADEFERVLTLLADLDSEESEIVATLYAAWNDLLLESKPVSDDIVITEFREHWGVPRKASFQPARLRVWLDWMRKNQLIPRGHGPSTRHQAELI